MIPATDFIQDSWNTDLIFAGKERKGKVSPKYYSGFPDHRKEFRRQNWK